ncbi:hypothetical protein GCM10028809_33450 [Spirosoma gilvum]
MDKRLLLVLILSAALLAPIGYITLLINWFKNYTSGVYSYNSTEVLFETVAVLIYTFLGIRFFNRHVNSAH